MQWGKIKGTNQLALFGSARYISEGEARSNIPLEYNRILDIVEDYGRYIIVYRRNSVRRIKAEVSNAASQEIRQLEKELRNLENNREELES